MDLDKMGSIEVGKTANMIVIDRNILEIPGNEIGATRVLKTILDGESGLRKAGNDCPGYFGYNT